MTEKEKPHVRLEVPLISEPADAQKKGKKEKDVLKAATQVVEEGDSDSEEEVTPDEPANVTKDRKIRGKYEYALLKKTKELHAVEERLYYVRWDKSRAPADMKREVLNLAKEWARLHTALNILIEKSQRSFEESLALGDIGLPKDLDDDVFKPPVNLPLDASISNIKVADDLILDELESQKFMRTKSTQTLKDRAPKQKWDGLMSMFKEWKHHSAVAEGQQVLQRKPSGLDPAGSPVIVHPPEDVSSLRTAIYQLRQRKNLSKGDQALLKKMTQKLADMTNANGV